MLDVVIVGSAVLDNFVLLEKSYVNRKQGAGSVEQDECFLLGSKIEVKKILQQTGGGATNSAVTFHKQGLSCQIISKVGDDTSGRLIIDELERDGLKTNQIIKDKDGLSGQSVILVDPSGERTILVDRGTSGHISTDNLDVLDNLKSRWVYLTSLNGAKKSIDTVLSWAVQNSVKVAWNPGVVEMENCLGLIKQWLKTLSFLVINRSEAVLLLGHEGDVDELAIELQKLGCYRVAITNGIENMAVLDSKKITIIKPEVVKAVDSTGAGDAFGSGVVAGLLKGLSFKQAVEFGMLNAKHVVLKYGAKTGIIREAS